MPRYVYSAKASPQKVIQADIEAESEQDAINKIARLGYFPISVKNEDLSLEKKGALRFWNISKKDIVFFSTQLSTLVESGINILNSINLIATQTNNKYLKAVLNDVVAKIKDGKPLSASLATHPDLFSNLYTAMIHSGEASGNLELILKRLSEFMEKEEEFKNSLRSSLTYPIFIIGVSILTVVVLLTFVIPKLVSMFEDMGQALPLPTKILIGVSAFLRGYWWLIFLGLGLAIFLFFRFYHTAQGKVSVDRLKLRLAFLGKITLKSEISRMMRTFSLLLAGGVSVVTSLDISVTIVENEILKQELQKFKEQIAGGLNFSKCLNESKLFPQFVKDIIAVGEETGTLEKSLLRIADDYEKDVDATLKGMLRMLEPMIILVMGLIVGFIVISMLLPIFQINLMAK